MLFEKDYLVRFAVRVQQPVRQVRNDQNDLTERYDWESLATFTHHSATGIQ